MIKVTIITVAYNAISTIEQTILSVINQTYSNIEYIIIDGGSTDGTVDIIKKYVNKITYWISESDKGIYDAMNKGIKVSTGVWVNFMNCGDIFHDQDVVSAIMEYELSHYLVIYGKTLMKYRWGKYIVTPVNLSVLSVRMPFCHQSTFVKSSFLKEHMFNLNYKIAADYKLFYSIYMDHPNSFFYYPNIISEYDSVYGISSVSVKKNYDEIELISQNSKGRTRLGRIKIYVLLHFPQGIIDLMYKAYLFPNKRYVKVK